MPVHSELEFNGLSGEFPGETNLKSLEKLNLADQYLNDQECIRSDGTVVNTLFMRGDQANPENLGMAGEILGPQIGQLPSLKEITIRYNSFNGSIAPEIGNLQNLGKQLAVLEVLEEFCVPLPQGKNASKYCSLTFPIGRL